MVCDCANAANTVIAIIAISASRLENALSWKRNCLWETDLFVGGVPDDSRQLTSGARGSQGSNEIIQDIFEAEY